MIVRAIFCKYTIYSRFSTTACHNLVKRPHGKVKLVNNLFKPDAVKKLMAQDGIGADFRLIYREASSFKSHMIFQALGLVVPLFPFYFAYKKWQDSFVFKSYLAPAALILWWCACSFYNLRMFYRVPHRLYHSHQSGTYKVVLNQLLPWQKKLVVPFRPNEISHVDIDKSGWKVTGITKFELVPVQRTLWLDKDSFHTAKDYWILCGRQIGEVGQLEK